MLESLEIENFKSIERVRLDCRRVNVLIGEPNTGKSNILEALGLISYIGHFNTAQGNLRSFVRHDDLSNLFHDGDLSRELAMLWNGGIIRDVPPILERGYRLQLRYSNGHFEGGVEDLDVGISLLLSGGQDALAVSTRGLEPRTLSFCKFYRFAPRSTFPRKGSDYLMPPDGDNLFSLLYQDRELRDEAKDIFISRGLRLGLRMREGTIEVLKDIEDVIVSNPYHLASDTFQRLVFYAAALRTNSDSVLVFEEPEAHAFPYYTKYLAERIALDERGNQYFISTHNPYFLLPLIEKTRVDEIAVFITYYDDYQTKLKELSPDDLSTILDQVDVFSNIEMFLEDR